MTPTAFAWLATALAVGYVVLPILVATLAVNVGLRITKARRLSFADALGLIGIYVGASLLAGSLIRPAHEALGIPPAWAVSVLSLLGGGIVFVALLRKRAELSVTRAAGIFGIVLGTLILFALVVILPLRLLVMAPYVVRGDSMTPTLPDNVLLLADKLSYRIDEPQRGDIALVRPPFDPNVYYIKRIIGLPGEEIQFRDGAVVIVNKGHPEGFILQEPYLAEGVRTEPWIDAQASIAVPDDAYVVLGDNREHANDSRVWGVVPRDNVIAKAGLILFPPNYAGVVERPAYGRAEIDAMDREIGKIDAALGTFQAKQVALNEKTTEGATVTGYFDGPVLRKIVATLYGEHGQTFTEYYLASNGEAFFVRHTKRWYDTPLTSSATPEIVGLQTGQRYFAANKQLVPTSEGDPYVIDLSQEEQALLDGASRYRAALPANAGLVQG